MDLSAAQPVVTSAWPGGSDSGRGANAYNGYALGSNANAILSGSTIDLTATVSSQFTGAGFKNSAFASTSIVAGNISFISPSVNAAGNILASGAIAIEAPGVGTLTSTSATGFDLTAQTLTFSGKSLAIISASGITAGNIDLSSPTASGGSLTLIADANFSPAVNNPTLDTTSTFQIVGASGNSGNINVGSISTYSITGGNGGSVTTVAYNGTATLGAVDTHSTTGTGGSVQVIAQGVQIESMGHT